MEAAEGARDQAGEVAEKAGQQAGQVGGQARDQARGLIARLKEHKPGPLGWVALIALAAALVVGAAIVATLLAPVLLFFSPILIPAAIALFLGTAGLVTAGGAGVATLSAASWLYRYLTGKHPRGSDRVDRALGRAHHVADNLKHKAHDVVG